MAKSGVLEEDPAMVAKSMEMKKELQNLVKAISDDEDFNLEAIDKAQRTLYALKELRLKKNSVSFKIHNDPHDGHEIAYGLVPEEFKCPISKELMRDPVIISSGQTFDRTFVQKWLKSGNRTCPQTQQVLSHTLLTPNHLIREMISQWCKNHGIKFSDSIQYLNNDEDALTESDRNRFDSLLDKMSSTLSDQKDAAKELRQLTKRSPSFRALFSESPDAISKLLSPLSETRSEDAISTLQEDIITALLNLSIHDDNKKLVAETPKVIPLLVYALKSGTIQTRTNASATLFTLSALDSNKTLIGKSGALKPLIELLDEGDPLAMTDVASAIFNLCIVHGNKSRAVSDGAVRVIMKKIMSGIHVDELLSVIAVLSTSQRAIEEMVELGAVSCFLNIIRETSCARSKENCIAILCTICNNDRSKLKEIREEENRHGSISQLASNGTSRAKRKASGILERMDRVFNVMHTA
ncbi:hypothetical protein OROGR_002445 [Orobanche gracilis]